MLQILSETDSNKFQQLSGAVLQLQHTQLQKFQADLPLWRTFGILLRELRSNSDIAFLEHGVSEDQHIFLQVLQSVRLAVPLWYLVPCRLRLQDQRETNKTCATWLRLEGGGGGGGERGERRGGRRAEEEGREGGRGEGGGWVWVCVVCGVSVCGEREGGGRGGGGGADGAITSVSLSIRTQACSELNAFWCQCTSPFGWSDQPEKRPLRLSPPRAGSGVPSAGREAQSFSIVSALDALDPE